jgi:hypothetical protein
MSARGELDQAAYPILGNSRVFRLAANAMEWWESTWFLHLTRSSLIELLLCDCRGAMAMGTLINPARNVAPLRSMCTYAGTDVHALNGGVLSDEERYIQYIYDRAWTFYLVMSTDENLQGNNVEGAFFVTQVLDHMRTAIVEGPPDARVMGVFPNNQVSKHPVSGWQAGGPQS